MSVIKVKNEQGSFEEISTLTGQQGPQGNPGIGIAGGGQVNTFLAKNSSTDYDTSWKNIFDLIYPIGSIYMSVSNTSPDALFGGSWEKIEDKFLLGSSDKYLPNDQGGNTTHSHTTQGHALTEGELPPHSHGAYLNASAGNDHTTKTRINYTDSTPAGWIDYSVMSVVGLGQSHSHGNTGQSSNMPPYIAVNIWKRIG